MARRSRGSEEVDRLNEVRREFRRLVEGNPWLADETRRAYFKFQVLLERRSTAIAENRRRVRRMARALLVNGRTSEPRIDGEALLVVIRGPCSSTLAEKLNKRLPSKPLPPGLERHTAAAALKAMDLEDGVTKPGSARAYRVWRIWLKKPWGWWDPPDPNSNRPNVLQRFHDEDYHTIYLYRLGGLADVGAARPVVPQPSGTDDTLADALDLIGWQVRLTTDVTAELPDFPELEPSVFPVELAEQMLDTVKGLVERRKQDVPPTGASRENIAQAYGAATAVLRHASTLTFHARHLCQNPSEISSTWQKHAGTFAEAMIAQHFVQPSLTAEVLAAARSVYDAGSPPIRVEPFTAKATVIEAVSDFATSLRNIVYQDRATPLEMEDIRTKHDAFAAMSNEWKQQNPPDVPGRLSQFAFRAIDFDAFQVQLDREARAVLAVPPPRPIDRRKDGWTKAHLIELTKTHGKAISLTTFGRVQKRAKVKAGRRGKKGRLYTPQEAQAMLGVVDKAAPELANQIRAAWEPLVRDISK